MDVSTALVKCASTGKGQVLSLNRCWLSLGMKSRTKEMASRTVWIFNVEVDPNNRGQGRAKAALSALVNAADAHGITLKLDAVPLDDVTDKSDLVRLYENMGFKIIGTSVGYAVMHRLPMSETTKRNAMNTKTQPIKYKVPALAKWNTYGEVDSGKPSNYEWRRGNGTVTIKALNSAGTEWSVLAENVPEILLPGERVSAFSRAWFNDRTGTYTPATNSRSRYRSPAEALKHLRAWYEKIGLVHGTPVHSSLSLSEISSKMSLAGVQHVLVQATTGDDVFTPYLKLIEAGRKKNIFHTANIKPSFIKKAIALHPEYGVAKYLELGKHAAAEIEEARSEWKEVFDTAFYKQYKRKPDFADSARVSGVGDDKLPAPVKEKLRELAYRQSDLERVIVLMNTLMRKRDLAKTFLIWAKLAKVFGEKASIRVIVREFKHKNEIELKYDVDEDRIDYNVFENGVLVTDGFIGKDHAPKAVERAVTLLTNILHDFQKKGK